jgi:hypothetical protein
MSEHENRDNEVSVLNKVEYQNNFNGSIDVEFIIASHETILNSN